MQVGKPKFLFASFYEEIEKNRFLELLRSVQSITLDIAAEIVGADDSGLECYEPGLQRVIVKEKYTLGLWISKLERDSLSKGDGDKQETVSKVLLFDINQYVKESCSRSLLSKPKPSSILLADSAPTWDEVTSKRPGVGPLPDSSLDGDKSSRIFVVDE